MTAKAPKNSPWPLVIFVLLAFGLSLGAWVVFGIVASKTNVESIEVSPPKP